MTIRIECKVCCWATTGPDYKAEPKADTHTEETGHPTVDVEE